MCRAANSSIEASRVGLPVGEPEMRRCPRISGNAGMPIGSVSPATTCIRPFGLSAARYAGQSSEAVAVISRKSSVPSAAFGFRLEAMRWAPKAFASAPFDSVDVNAVTSQPQALANLMPMCPRPPMPTTPTCAVGWISNTASGAKTVTPPHRSGPVDDMSISSGNAIVHAQCARIRSANPP